MLFIARVELFLYENSEKKTGIETTIYRYQR